MPNKAIYEGQTNLVIDENISLSPGQAMTTTVLTGKKGGQSIATAIYENTNGFIVQALQPTTRSVSLCDVLGANSNEGDGYSFNGAKVFTQVTRSIDVGLVTVSGQTDVVIAGCVMLAPSQALTTTMLFGGIAGGYSDNPITTAVYKNRDGYMLQELPMMTNSVPFSAFKDGDSKITDASGRLSSIGSAPMNRSTGFAVATGGITRQAEHGFQLSHTIMITLLTVI